uniref:Uncharacterized protein n=1 Tax=Romanomermis culicivorax TaxID=13658 RepID=A0A915KJ53_ROMCU
MQAILCLYSIPEYIFLKMEHQCMLDDNITLFVVVEAIKHQATTVKCKRVHDDDDDRRTIDNSGSKLADITTKIAEEDGDHTKSNEEEGSKATKIVKEGSDSTKSIEEGRYKHSKIMQPSGRIPQDQERFWPQERAPEMSTQELPTQLRQLKGTVEALFDIIGNASTEDNKREAD